MCSKLDRAKRPILPFMSRSVTNSIGFWSVYTQGFHFTRVYTVLFSRNVVDRNLTWLSCHSLG